MPKIGFWTRDNREALRALWAGGAKTADIGDQLGCSKNAVVGQAHRMGLDARPSPIRRRDGSLPAPKPRAPTAPRNTLPKLASVEALAGETKPLGYGGAAALIRAQARQPVTPPEIPPPVVTPRATAAPAGASVAKAAPSRTCLWTDGERGRWIHCEAPRVRGVFCEVHAKRGLQRGPDEAEAA